MDVGKELRQFPLGIPLVVASVGTVATLFGGRQLHAGFGIAWAALSLWHGWQHGKKMQGDAKRLVNGAPCCPRQEGSSPLASLLAGLQVDSFCAGRVRVRSLCFVGNEALARQAEDYVKSFAGVTGASVSTLTGSLLITYDPAALRKKPKLAALERRVQAMAAGGRP